jgi:hypothetical protein
MGNAFFFSFNTLNIVHAVWLKDLFELLNNSDAPINLMVHMMYFILGVTLRIYKP